MSDITKQINNNVTVQPRTNDDNLANLQSFAIGMGFAKKEALKFSTSIQGMVFDFASFNNISDKEAFDLIHDEENYFFEID